MRALTKVVPAAVPSVLPSWNVWEPSSRCESVFGEVHDANGLASTLHSNVAPASVEWKLNVGVGSKVVLPGPESMTVSAGCASKAPMSLPSPPLAFVMLEKSCGRGCPRWSTVGPIGLLPWSEGGYLLWGSVLGCSFYDQAAAKFTINTPANRRVQGCSRRPGPSQRALTRTCGVGARSS